MMHVNTVERTQLLKMAREYSYYIAAGDLGTFKLIARNTLVQTDHDRLAGNNPENVDTGMSGIALFVMEFYKQSGDAQCAVYVETIINELLEHCRQNPTSNYSLYTGRGGVVYVLLQYYLTSNNKALLKSALDIIRFANEDYLHSRYTSDYLYDGRSGTLLVMLHLYLLTREPFLLEYIDQFISKTIDNAYCSREGIFWWGEGEVSLKPSCGFAHGAAGIRYVFDQLYRHSGKPAFKFLLEGIDRFIDTCWIEEVRNWGTSNRNIFTNETLSKYKRAYLKGDVGLFDPAGNYGWANGATGIMLATDKSEHRRGIDDKLGEIIAADGIGSRGLYNGLAGMGMYLFEKGRGSYDFGLQNAVTKISGRLASPSAEELQGGLFHGVIGEVYFLLKASTATPGAENILMPFACRPADTTTPSVNMPITLTDVKRRLLSRCFPRTIGLLEKIEPGTLTAHLDLGSDASAGEVDRFAGFVFGDLARKAHGQVYERITDVFALEKQKFELRYAQKRPYLLNYLEWLQNCGYALEHLNKPDTWLLNQTLSVSGGISILTTRWNWKFSDELYCTYNRDLQSRHAQNLEAPAGNFQYIMAFSGKPEITETFLKTEFQLLLHLFEKPRSAREALVQIKAYVASLPAKDLKTSLPVIAEFSNAGDFLENLDYMILYQVRQWVYEKVLLLN